MKVYQLTAFGHSAMFNRSFKAVSRIVYTSQEAAEKNKDGFRNKCLDKSCLDYTEEKDLEIGIQELEVEQ